MPRLAVIVISGLNSKMQQCGSVDGFRYVLVCSTLSGKPVRFDGVRENEADLGLREEEVEFLRLLEAVSNGCVVELHRTGTRLASSLSGSSWLCRVSVQTWTDFGRHSATPTAVQAKRLLLPGAIDPLRTVWKKSEKEKNA